MSVIAAMGLLGKVQLESTLPKIPREFRAAWVATVDNIDWPSSRNLSSDQQRNELLAIVLQAKQLKLNALVFQIRPHADAMYPSAIEPWSAYLTGQQGKAPNPLWDPLKFMVDECHKRGIELHVWFNPYRANHFAQKSPVASSHISKTDPGLVKKYDRFEWMDPGEPAVKKRTLDVFMDVTKRYDIDGVHIDDYFYPYPDSKKTQFPDEPSFKKYQSSGGKLSRDDWRRANVDSFIKEFYAQLKRTKRHVKFGISPFGIYRPGIPAGIKAGVDQYGELYADAKKWLVEGWCDYYTPQLYWPIDQAPQSYRTLLDWWVGQNPTKRHLWPGLFTGRTDPNGGNWKPAEVENQIKLSRDKQWSAGNVHFSFKSLQRDFNGIGTALKNGVYAKSAFVPESPWLGDAAPKRPDVRIETDTGSSFVKIVWDDRAEFAHAVCPGRMQGKSMTWGEWQTLESGATVDPGEVTHLAIVRLSRSSIASPPQILDLPRP